MSNRRPDIRIHDYAREELPEPAVAAIAALLDAQQAELWPDDPPLPRATQIADIRTPDELGARTRWCIAWRDEAAVGFARTTVELESNPDIVWLHVYVAPQHRRRGIGRSLARHALGEARLSLEPAPSQTGYDIVLGSEIGRELQARFEQDWALPIGIVGRKARLDLATVDRAAIESVLARRRTQLGEDFRFLFFENLDTPGPETGFSEEDFCASYEEIMNLMPLEDLQLERERFPPERWRSLLGRYMSTGRTFWNLVCCEPDGHVVGLTIVGFTTADHRRVEQWDTGVLADAQGQGIGSILKLDMLLRVMDGLPDVRFVETDNAGSNAPMIAINTALGFHEHHRTHVYQLTIDRLLALLGEDPA
jgi:ribosomal protein S18 acetylase RimI-like enzyme